MNDYLKAANLYLDADQASIPFKRISTSLIHSTSEFPEIDCSRGCRDL